jgi:hypothetical protein
MSFYLDPTESKKAEKRRQNIIKKKNGTKSNIHLQQQETDYFSNINTKGDRIVDETPMIAVERPIDPRKVKEMLLGASPGLESGKMVDKGYYSAKRPAMTDGIGGNPKYQKDPLHIRRESRLGTKSPDPTPPQPILLPLLPKTPPTLEPPRRMSATTPDTSYMGYHEQREIGTLEHLGYGSYRISNPRTYEGRRRISEYRAKEARKKAEEMTTRPQFDFDISHMGYDSVVTRHRRPLYRAPNKTPTTPKKKSSFYYGW